jgi:hypothetical protein
MNSQAKAGGAAEATTPSPSPATSDSCAGPGRLLATANRPTVGFSACAVKRDTVVLELGYQNEVRGLPDKGAVRSQIPQAFVRLGVANRFELDLVGPNYEAVRAYTPRKSPKVRYGVSDSGLGFKYEFYQTGRYTVAVDGLYFGPNGSSFLTAGNATLSGNLDASYSMSPATSIGTTVAVSSTGGQLGAQHLRYGLVMPSLVMTTQIPNYYQFYAEYVVTSKATPRYGARAFTDFGVQKLLGTRTEIDLEYGHAFTGIAPLKFEYIGAGLTAQFW